jgi:dipeptidyl-peptidase 4
MRCLLLACLTVTAIARPAFGQHPVPTESLRRLFGTRDFSGERFGPARWMGDGGAYTTVEASPEVSGGEDLVRYETASGARRVVVSARQLTPAGGAHPLAIDDYAWGPGDSLLLVFTNTRRVWRQNTRGDYWVLNVRSGALHQLGGDAPEATLMYAKFSPAGDRVAYVRQGDLYVEQLRDDHITRLTRDGDSLHVNGMSDWVCATGSAGPPTGRGSPTGTST